MNTPEASKFYRRDQRSYTLVELIAVMGIMAILLATTLPMISSLNESSNITQGGQVVADEIVTARQLASARDETIEVRCINDTNLALYGFSAMQLWSPSLNAPLSRVLRLPDGIVISQDRTQVSTLFASYYNTNAMPTGGLLAGAGYLSFTINPSGMLGPLSKTGTPPYMTNLYVGIVPERSATSTTLPPNYMLIQLNPLTAAATTYRP